VFRLFASLECLEVLRERCLVDDTEVERRVLDSWRALDSFVFVDRIEPVDE
jgi:hypothetical protein